MRRSLGTLMVALWFFGFGGGCSSNDGPPKEQILRDVNTECPDRPLRVPGSAVVNGISVNGNEAVVSVGYDWKWGGQRHHRDTEMTYRKFDTGWRVEFCR
jgi:hypothetical protein